MIRDECRYAVWLDPEPTALDAYRACMDELRAGYGGPPIPPHLTLTSGLGGDEQRCIDRFIDLLTGHQGWCMHPKPEALRIGGGNPYQAVVVSCRRSTIALRLRKRIRHQAGLPDQPWRPHLSLLYATLDDGQRRAIADAYADRDWPVIPISSCSLWRLQGPVEHWRCVARQSLLQPVLTTKE